VEVKDYYAELPIAIRLTGRFHDIGAFAADIANQPRIVTLHNLSVTPFVGRDGVVLLAMEATARTYRYLDGAEVAEMRRQAQERAKGARK
jgi:type IV pilus assembly protein PilO